MQTVQCTHIPYSVFYPLNVCGYWWCGCSVKNIYLQIIIQTQLLFGIQRACWWKMCSVHKQQTFSLYLIPNKIQFRVQFSSQIGNECWTFLTCNVCLSNAPSISSQQHPTVLERMWKMISKINSIYTPRFFGNSSNTDKNNDETQTTTAAKQQL